MSLNVIILIGTVTVIAALCGYFLIVAWSELKGFRTDVSDGKYKGACYYGAQLCAMGTPYEQILVNEIRQLWKTSGPFVYATWKSENKKEYEEYVFDEEWYNTTLKKLSEIVGHNVE